MIRYRTVGIAALGASALLLAGCGGVEDPLADQGPEGGDDGAIVVGSANFAENVLLGELYAQVLEESGLQVQRTFNVGSREVLVGQVESCGLDVVPEYNQALLNFQDPENDAIGNDEVNAALDSVLPESVATGEPSPAQSNNALAVTTDTATTYGLESIADLAPVADELVMGGPPEFETRWDGLEGLKAVYDVTFGEYTVLGDISGPISVAALNGGDVDVAMMQTASPAMAENDFVVLEDSESVLGVNHVLPFYCEAGLPEDALAELEGLGAALSTEDLQQMNYLYSVEKMDADQVATDWLTENDLI